MDTEVEWLDSSLPMIWDVTAPSSLSTFIKQTFEQCFNAPEGILYRFGFDAQNELGRTIVKRNLSEDTKPYPDFKYTGHGREDSIILIKIPFLNDERARSIWNAIGETLQSSQDSPFIRIVILDRTHREIRHLWTGRFRLRTIHYEMDGQYGTAEFVALLFYNDIGAIEAMKMDIEAAWVKTESSII